ncbi:protein PAT1 homolog 1-like [Glandiceps talaboti]
MSDSFFGFDASLPAFRLCDLHVQRNFTENSEASGVGFEMKEQKPTGVGGIEENFEDAYDALNEDTFGAGATDSNWEASHEKFALEQSGHSFDEDDKKPNRSLDSGFHTGERPTSPQDDYMEQSISQLVLDDELDDPAIMVSSKAKPINMPRTPSSGYSRSIFSPSPPTLLDPKTLMSPQQTNIWSSPRVPSPDEKLKSLLNISQQSSSLPPSLVDSAIVTAIGDTSTRIPSPTSFQSPVGSGLDRLQGTPSSTRSIPMVMTAEELERNLRSRAPPPRTVSPVFGSPPSTALPIGTPPKPQFFQQAMQQHTPHQNTGTIPPHVIHQMQQQIARSGGKISPTQLNQMIQEGRASPLKSHPLAYQHMSPGIPPPPQGSLFSHGHIPPNMAAQMSPGMRGRSSPPQYSPMGPNPHLNRMPGQGGGGDATPYNRHQYYNQRSPYNSPNPNYDGRYNRYDNRNRYNNRYHNQQDRSNGNGVRDEYANLMTQKEKDWIIKIQMMQLQSNNPYLDDYYYQTYVLRKRAKDRQSSSEGVQSEEKNSDPKIIMPQAKQTEARQYKPAHFEGTLGTVTVASVNNPRKMIDVGLPAVHEDEQSLGSKELSVRKRAHLLLGIEKVYSLLLDLEDLEKKALALPEDDSEIEQERQRLVNQIYNNLNVPSKPQSGLDCYFVQMLGISKGRKLIARILPVLNRQQALAIVHIILYNLNYVIKKDSQDNSLSLVYPSVSSFMKTCDLETLVTLMNSLTSGTSAVSPMHHGNSSVLATVQNKFGVSMICVLLARGEDILSTQSPVDINPDTESDWTDVVLKIGKELINVAVDSLAIPIESNPKVLEQFARYVDKQTFLALQHRIKTHST